MGKLHRSEPTDDPQVTIETDLPIPRSRFSMNDYNLDDGGEFRRGSLVAGDGLVVPALPNNRGWVPSAVRIPLLARNVRHAVEWRCEPTYRPGLVHRVSGMWLHQRGGRWPAPFGWAWRRERDRDVWLLAPRWYFIPRDIANWWYGTVMHFLKHRLGAVDGPECGLWSEHRWWPSCPRWTE